MSKADFDAFVKRQQAEAQAQEAKFDAGQQLREWLEYLNNLHEKIRSFLKKYLESGGASISVRNIELNEDFIGAYVAPELILVIGRSTVTFTPVGTMLIGSKGRVDVRGPLGSARLVLINKKISNARQLVKVTVTLAGDPPAIKQPVEPIEWEWKISNPLPNMTFSELTEEAFFDLVLTLSNG